MFQRCEEHRWPFRVGHVGRRQLCHCSILNSQTGDRMLPDLEGEDLSDVAAARTVAMTTAREALLEALKSGDSPPDHIYVADGEGREVMTVDLSELLRT
jgi:hypothetical protein